MQTGLKGAPEGATLSPVWVLNGALKSALALLVREVVYWQKAIRRIGESIIAWARFVVTDMVPKNIRNMADKTEGARQTRTAEEGSDGHLAGKRLTGGPTMISCKVSAGTGTVKDGKDLSRGVQPDNTARDRTQNKLQPIITIFLPHGEQGNSTVNPILLSTDVPTTIQEALGETSHGEEGLCAGNGLLESSLDPNRLQACGGDKQMKPRA
ncbi:hypothetical protein NDU88_005599 [Pleurodeles waltl]|uniref:Uncharacterized protein n=1 Tax=Pleurodeles waltl TaxID=8319 RepID=A0AAV7WV53_PLEWA|nr:hypothetical protein NDU88_005599 [Pleurodeles waltl]